MSEEQIIVEHLQNVVAVKDNPSSWVKPTEETAPSYQTDINIKSRRRKMLYSAMQRARNEQIPFNLTIEDIVIPSHCPILGIPLFYSDGKHFNNNSPSLDKHIPSLGYVKGNVSVISMKANNLKRDGTKDEIVAVAAFMLRGLPLVEAGPPSYIPVKTKGILIGPRFPNGRFRWEPGINKRTNTVWLMPNGSSGFKGMNGTHNGYNRLIGPLRANGKFYSDGQTTSQSNLRLVLSNGKQKVFEVYIAMEALGTTIEQTRLAARQMNIFKGEHIGKDWYWSLPTSS